MDIEQPEHILAEAAGAPSPEGRQAVLENLFITSYSHLRQFCFDLWDGLLVWDTDAVLERLPVLTYTGPVESEPFLEWAQAHLAAEVRRIRFVTEAATKHRPILYKAIRKAYAGQAVNPVIDEDDLFMETLALAYGLADNLLEPGDAALSTRLYGLGGSHAGFARIKRDRRSKCGQKRGLGAVQFCETASSLEDIMASQLPPSDVVRASA